MVLKAFTKATPVVHLTKSYSSKNPYGNKTSNLYYHIFEMFKSFT